MADGPGGRALFTGSGVALVTPFGEGGVDEEALGELVRKATTVDPRACRAEAERRFTPAVMAESYLRIYERIRSGI